MGKLIGSIAHRGGKIAIQFGKTGSQIYHAFRHTDALGLNRRLVQSSIHSHFKTVSSNVVAGNPSMQLLKLGERKYNILHSNFQMENLILAEFMELIRKPTTQEIALLEVLIKKSSLGFPPNWKNNLMVCPLDDGGMGSLSLCPEKGFKGSRKFSRQISEYQFRDEDEVEVIASLYVDEYDNLFELDIWKTNFSKLIRIPKSFSI